MIGVFDHDRNRVMIEEPSRSGKPRSRIMRSGGFSVAERMPSSASHASCTVNPSNSKAARKNCRIWSSSSMTSMVALPIVDHREIQGCGFLRLLVDDLPECLFKQDGVNVDEGQFVRNIQ